MNEPDNNTFGEPANAGNINCMVYHKKCLSPIGDGYVYDERSGSGLFFKGSSSSLKVTMYAHLDYRISICSSPELGPEIRFQILDAKSSEVLYDNKKENFSTRAELTTTVLRPVVMKVAVPTNLKDGVEGCVGILIEFKPSAKIA